MAVQAAYRSGYDVSMSGFILRIVAFHGMPKKMGNEMYVRASLSHESIFTKAEVVNNPENLTDVVIDMNYGQHNARHLSQYTLDLLIDDFQTEHKCMINYGDSNVNCMKTFEFEVFEPGWLSESEALKIIDALFTRLSDWICGYPTGRHVTKNQQHTNN